MKKWYGSAGICINEHGQLLMVLQGTPEEEKTWSVPSGSKNQNETFEACCTREVFEETGYEVEVIERLKLKETVYDDWQIEAHVHYYLVKITGGKKQIQDPDNLIYEIAWKSVDDLKTLKLTYPEDREFLIDVLSESAHQDA